MTNSLATFQTMINNIFRDLIAKEIVVVYLDNILIFTRTVEQYTKAIWRVLEILAEYKLCLCPEKCEFQKECIEYLGLVVLENKVSIDPIKVAEVQEWPTPKSQTGIQTFLGFVNFYRHFIQDFSAIAQPLFNLIYSDQTWEWEDKEQTAFKALKMAVTSALVLVSPHGLESFQIEANSLDYTMGAVLSQ